MSINHYSSTDLSETQLWSHYVMESSAKTSSSHNHHHHHQYHHNPFISTHHLLPHSTATFCLTAPHGRTAAAGGPMFKTGFSFNLKNEDEEESAADEQVTEERESSSNHNDNGGNPREVPEQDEIPKEPLFEKPLTPSDVGKLNRLVIPKQHAEKHFPLNGTGAGAAESGENGLLLSFEDEVGKSWRFRYSYWNSSQSYVLTKGWSRFVKDKRLDAGDIVVFSRRRGDAGRLFIGWRRRNSIGGGQDGGGSQAATAVGRGGGRGWNRQIFYSGQQYPYQTQNQAGPHSLSYQPECLHAGSIVQNQTPSASSGNSKTLRLFGVNLECQSEPSTPVGSPMSAQAQAQAQAHYHHQQHQYYSNNHMDISFSGGDVYRQG